MTSTEISQLIAIFIDGVAHREMFDDTLDQHTSPAEVEEATLALLLSRSSSDSYIAY